MSPTNSARTPSTAHENGLNRDTASSQPGANGSVIGSRIPESRNTGTATVFISGASVSSLRTFSRERMLVLRLSVWQRVRMHEVEAKFRVADVEVLLLALKARGVELGPPVVQDDQAYAPASWRYGQPKIGVPFARLRTEAGRHVFTVKVPGDNELSCAEHETEVADRDQMHAAVAAMGFTPTVRIVKTRRRSRWGEVSLCVDEVTGLGVFLELELMETLEASGVVAQAGLVDLVAELGVETERVEDTYDSLLRAASVG